MKTSKKNQLLHTIVNTLHNREEICFSFTQYNKNMLLCMHKQDGLYWAELSTETSPIKKAFVSGETYDKLIAYLNKRLTMPTTSELLYKVADRELEMTQEVAEDYPF